uniref:LY6/PLAUR domain containing 4 n=1 Tax=Suricata suricatta TaxID=37032 RepID=A0A673UEK5_SURSU
MGPQHLSHVQLLCLLGAICALPWAGALLCYEATSSLFRAVSLHNWKWLLMRSMVCKLSEGCEETLVFIETGEGSRRGVVGFKGCSPAPSYPPQVSYLVSPPGLSIASYSRVCSCPTCVGEHSKDCLPYFVTTDSCPYDASQCYSSTLKFQAGLLNTTFLLMGCARGHQKLLADFHHIGNIRVTEVLNIIERAQIAGAEPSGRSPAWGILSGLLLLVFRD